VRFASANCYASQSTTSLKRYRTTISCSSSDNRTSIFLLRWRVSEPTRESLGRETPAHNIVLARAGKFVATNVKTNSLDRQARVPPAAFRHPRPRQATTGRFPTMGAAVDRWDQVWDRSGRGSTGQGNGGNVTETWCCWKPGSWAGLSRQSRPLGYELTGPSLASPLRSQICRSASDKRFEMLQLSCRS
jgi:hypothetical protein